jgi:group I intron endonuclease
LILEREQFYIDSLEPAYNINPIAGSRLGTRHTNETKALISEAKTGENHPKFGISLSDDIITKISVAKGGVLFMFMILKAHLLILLVLLEKRLYL